MLKLNNVSANLTEVLAITTDSKSGSFASSLTNFTQAGLSIEYMYCVSMYGKSILILRTNNQDAAIDVIRKKNMEFIVESDLINL